MSSDLAAPESRQGGPTQLRATGTVRRGDPRRRPPAPSPRGVWIFGGLAVVVGGLLIGWIMVGGPPAAVNTATSTATSATSRASPVPAAAPTPEPATSRTVGPAQLTPAAPSIAPSSIPAPEPSPVPTQQPGLTLDFPLDGEVVSVRDITVIGTAPALSTVTRDIPMWFDDHTVTRPDGIWMLPVHLDEGQNVLRLRIGDDRSTEQVVRVLYQP